MKFLRTLIPLLALLALDGRGQNEPAAITNASQAERARQLLRGTTNTFRPAGGPIQPGAQSNGPIPNAVAPPSFGPAPAPAANTNPPASLAPTPGGVTTTTVTAPPTFGPAPSTTVTTPVPLPGAATPPGVAAQVPTRTPPQFPTFPTPGAATAPGATSTTASNLNPAPGASTNAVDQQLIDPGELSLKGAPLDQVFDMYQLYSGRTILRPYTLPAQGITLFAASALTPGEAVQALDSVLALNGIVMINLGTKFVKAVPAAQAEKEGAEIDVSKASDLPSTEQFVTKVVTLKTAKPTEVATVIAAFSKSASAVTPIDSNMTLVLRDYSSNVKRMMELIEKIDVLPEKDFKLEVIPIRYGKVTDIYATMSALISGGGGGAGGSGFAATGVGGRGATGMGGMGMGNSMMNRGRSGMGGMGGYGGSSYNRGGYGGSQYGNYGGGYGGTMYPQQVAQPSPAAAQNSFQQRLNNIVSRASQPDEQKVLENANIVPDERSNTLLIFANKRDMEMITNIVNKVDVLLAQVLIEAVILEVSFDDSLNYGVTAAQSAKQFTPNFQGAGAMRPRNGPPIFSSLTNFPSGAPEGFSYFGKLGANFDVAISAVSSGRKANVVSRPRIQTSHAIPGDIFVGQTRPYVTGFSDFSLGTSLSTRSTVQERTIGLTLSVTPFITPDGLVVMELQQQFDSYKGDITVENNPYPLVDSRMASSMLTVRDGDLIMLGGFITESHSKEKNGVPVLKDIPGLGALFRSTVKSSTRGELIILMKATVLQTPEEAAFLATQERATLPGVREAEMDQAKSDAKRNAKVNKRIQKGY